MLRKTAAASPQILSLKSFLMLVSRPALSPASMLANTIVDVSRDGRECCSAFFDVYLDPTQ